MKIFGVIILTLAAVIAAVPQFTNCQYEGKTMVLASGMKVPMKCLWTARAELATAVPLGAVGAFMLFSKRRESKRALGVMGMVLGAVVAALPTTELIGVCSSNMPCNTVMKPSLFITGGIVTAAGLAGIVLAQRTKEQI